ncbi:MAG TPA: DUF427 domain-containing protein [Pseudonocardia sp.]|nr:DUF427 domain-containing protein [Pseudonocardia sp.]
MDDRRPRPGRAGPGRESVWEYPRPPRLEADHRRAVLRYGGVVVADTTDLVRVLETSHPPTFYLPRTAFGARLVPVERTTFCEWKGAARYVDVLVGARRRCARSAGGTRRRIAATPSCTTVSPSTPRRSTRSRSTASG